MCYDSVSRMLGACRKLRVEGGDIPRSRPPSLPITTARSHANQLRGKASVVANGRINERTDGRTPACIEPAGHCSGKGRATAALSPDRWPVLDVCARQPVKRVCVRRVGRCPNGGYTSIQSCTIRTMRHRKLVKLRYF